MEYAIKKTVDSKKSCTMFNIAYRDTNHVINELSAVSDPTNPREIGNMLETMYEEQTLNSPFVKYIVINGKGGCGKDTFVRFCKEHISEITNLSFEFMNFSSIDIVKEIATQFGYNGAKDRMSRYMLSNFKRLLTEYNDFPFKYMLNTLRQFKADICYDNFLLQKEDEIPKYKNGIVFIHIREEQEIERLSKYINLTKLLVVRPETELKKYGNVSDDNIHNDCYDYVVYNDGLDKLEADAKQFMHKITTELSLSNPIMPHTEGLIKNFQSQHIDVEDEFQK